MAKAKSNILGKRYIKLLSVCRKPRELRAILQNAPDSVIKLICDAALNLLVGDYKLSPAAKSQFKKRKALVAALAGRQLSLKAKRIKLLSGGALPFLPIILGTALSFLGSRLFDKS
jgi:hypothetical protein